MSAVSSGPFCTALGCRSVAVVIIQTRAGPRPVCHACATDQEVLEDV
jgi:hypothetical protein